MSEFNIVECGFNVADETLNFGSRMLADGDHLFEAHTLATIKQSDANEKISDINIQTCCTRNKLYYIVNKTIGVFTNLTCTELSFNTVLEQKIDTFCVTPDSKFLFICQRNGMVLYINIEEQEIILTKDVVNNDCLEEAFFMQCFIEEYTKINAKFVIVAKSGSIYRLTYNMETNFAAILSLKEFGFEIRTSAIIFPWLLVDGEKMAVYNLATGDSINGDPLDLIKVFPYSQQMFIGLDSNGSLVRICGRTLFYFYIKSEPLFKDFIYITFGVNESCTGPYCLCVTHENNIQLYDSFPILSEAKFSLKVNNNVRLICPGNLNEEPMYISIIEKENTVQELRLQVVIETAPEVRLKQLLRRHKFDEAEQFAKTHNLNNTEVLKAKAQVIIDKRTCSNEDIFNLLNILNSIDDIFFKLQSCLDTYQSCENLDDVQKILVYGSNCLVKHNANIEASELHEMVLDIMFRFDTFKLLQGLDVCCFDWLEFHNCDLIDLLCTYLQKYNIDDAIILYNRLDRHTKLKLDESRIDIILNLLDSLPLGLSQPFLYCFVPLSLSYIPSTLPLFVEWLKRKVCSTEQEHFDKFPDNAIEFTDSTLRLMKGCSVNFQQQTMVHQDAMDDLANLIKALKTIQLLKNTYRIVVPLKEYLRGPKQLIQVLLSLELDDDVFHKLLQNFLRKFILENDLEPDTIFLEVIQSNLKYEEIYWLKVIPSILRNISSVDVKLSATKAVIDVANKPWNQTIKEMARSCLKYQHEIAKVIRKEVENEPLNTILKKYFDNLQNVLVDGSWDISQVVGRIIYCNEPTMITDVYQFCKTSREKHTANMMLIRYFLDKRDYMTALEILDNNSVEEIMDCSEDLIQNAKLFDEMGLLLRNEPYIEIISCLKSRLRNSKRPGNRTFISLADNLQVCSQIRSRFYTKLKVSDLELPKKRQDLITTLLYSLSRDVSDESISPTEAVDSCKRIATLLNESKELTMIKFCKILSNNLKTFIECANYINHNENDAKSLCLMATLILKSTCPTANQDDTLDTTSYVNEAAQESTANVKDEIKCLKIAQQLTTKAILRARLDELLPCVEVFNWTMANFYMIRNTNAIEKDLFVETYLPEFSEPSTSSLHCLKDIINTYISYCDVNPELKYLTYFQIADNKMTEAEFTNRIHQLPMMIQHLCLGGQSLTAFKVVLTLKHSLRHFKNIDSSVMQILNTIVKQCTKQLLQKVCSVNRIDTELTYWLLISCGRNESIVFINHQLSIFKREISKFKALAELALRILNNYKITASKKFYMEMIQVSNWWIRIPECQIPMKTFFVSSKEQLLESLIHHHHVDLEMIQAFCKDFNFNVQCYYQIYLKKNLLNWKPEYDKVEAVNGNINIHFKTSESELLERCTGVVKLMEAKESVYLFINNLRHEANYYHYEVFSTIFTLLTKLNKNKDHRRNLLLLQFLKTYRRISKPSDSEMEEWYTLFPDSQTIDPLSNWRMPFTPTLFSSDIWKIIRPELNLQTYKIWFEVIPTLDNILNKNEICSYVIKKIVSSGILQKHTCDPCVLYPIHDHLFELIDKCVQNMTNLEMATSAVYQLVMHTPKGADQVNAAKLCLKYAIQYKESGQENDPALLKAFIKVQKKYQSFAATHILHICQIDVEKYSNILLEPNELIDALYTDESIIERADRVLLNCPDINKAVDQLGILFNIDIHKARLTLLESLLSELSSLTTENDMNSANIKRAAYICRSEDTTDWQKYLLKVGLGESGKSTYYKANALSCFIIISDVLTIEESTETSFDEFRNYIDKLYLLTDLEYLGLRMDIEMLDKCKKTDLLRRLSRDVHNAITVKTMASICITYLEYDFKFWRIIINATISLNLIHLLRKYLNFLKNEPAFKYKKVYIEAWQTIINQSFESDTTDSVYLYNSCVDNMLAIQSCPVLPSLNLTVVFNKCCNLQMYEFAAIIIQYFPIEEQKEYVEIVVKSKRNVSSAVGKLFKFGICGTTKVQRMLESF